MGVVRAARLFSLALVPLVAEPAFAFKVAKKGKSAPVAGVKTPGVQIPAASLKPEAEIAAVSEALVSSDSVYVVDSSKNIVLKVDAKSSKVGEGLTGFKKPCGGIVNAFGSLWVPNCGDGTLARADGKGNKITATIPVSMAPGNQAIASSPDSIWLLTDERTTLARLDPEGNKLVAESRLPAGCNSLVYGEGALWVSCPKEDKVLRIDPNTNLVVNGIEIAGQPTASTAGEGSIWVFCQKEGKVARIDPKTNKVTATVELNLPNSRGSMAAGEGSIWVSVPGFPVSRIDPATDKVVQQFVGEGGGSIYIAAGSVWLSNPSQGKILRLDPKRIKATFAE